jgi:4-amino-4-deoxy-L-arabinose transferase-like glycosyltransferase
MPYDNLMGDETAPPEPPPSLTFNVALAAPPAAKPEPVAKGPAVPLPGVVVSDERPAYVPPLPGDEPEPLLDSPVPPAPPPPPFVPPAPPPARRMSISQLLDKVGSRHAPEDTAPPAEPVMWRASEQMGLSPSEPRPAPPPAPAWVPPAPPVPVPPPPPAPVPPPIPRAFAPAPVRTPPPAPAPARPAPPDDAADYVSHSEFDTQVLPHYGGLASTTAAPDADTVIAVAPPMRRAADARPSLRFVGLLLVVLLTLWLARLGAAPLFDVDEGAFAEATRELTVGHDWGSTTLNGADRFDKPILVYWLQALSLKTFGATEFAVRLPSALCAFLWCVALAQFAWRRYGPQVAIAAAGILATSLGPMLIGRAATADSLLNLLLTLATLDVWRHLENGEDAPRRRAFAWIGLGLLAKGPVAFLVPAAAAGLWLLAGRDRSRLTRLVADPTAWLVMLAIAMPWYCYALWRHGMAFVNGFVLHHNLDRFTGSMEGHRGSLLYYVELLPVLMLPWTPLLFPLARKLRLRWNEPVARFMLLWFGFVMVFFSLSGTKLPHYVLYGYTPLVLLIAQELVGVRRWVRAGLFVTVLACIVAGAASPWIARWAADGTGDALYRTLLSTAPVAPWVWLAVPLGLLVFALVIWIPNVRNYLSEADGALAAAVVMAGWLVIAVLPWWAQTLQEPIRTLAKTVPIAQMTLLDRQPLVQWRLHQPSVGYYLGKPVERRDPAGGDWALTRVDRLTPSDFERYQVVESVRGYALVRPTPAASEPLSSIGTAQAAAEAASAAAAAAAQASAAQKAAEEAAEAASVAAARAGLAPPPAPAVPSAPAAPKKPVRKTQP